MRRTRGERIGSMHVVMALVGLALLLVTNGCSVVGHGAAVKRGDFGHQPVGNDPAAKRGWTIEDVDLELVWVAPGSFEMGSKHESLYTLPRRTVRIARGYWIGKTEVTQAQYEALTGENPSAFKGQNLPVEQVSWHEAVHYCELLTERVRLAGRLPEGYIFRLPTEAEWEYAARGGISGRDTRYSGSHFAGRVAWHYGNSGGMPQPAGMKTANELGLHDMSGNVWEWVRDRWQYGYAYSLDGVPAGQHTVLRIRRGGSWGIHATNCSVNIRFWSAPESKYDVLGFRVVLGPPL